MEDALIDIKRQRVLLYWNELSRHKVDIEVALGFMSYTFHVRQSWIIRIIKTQRKKESIVLEHQDLDFQLIDAFVDKLHKKAKKERCKKVAVKEY